jgi:hypothetical protein
VKIATASPGTLCHDYAEAELEGISGIERKAEGIEELHTYSSAVRGGIRNCERARERGKYMA